jgi:NAD(P)H-dependent flavin oxidoreductase YrpB (nitropropane dioxygenase family)
MHTRICDMLGCEFPIVAFTHCRDVLAAVTNAGAFGVLGASGHTPDELEIDLKWIDEQVHGKEYGLDLLFPNMGVADPAATDAGGRFALPPEHVAFVEDMLRRHGVPDLPADELGAPSRANLTLDTYHEHFDIAFSHPVNLLVSALGVPPRELVDRAHEHDVLVGALAGSVVHAERNVAAGVDLVVAQGTEAGGHTGEISTMVLVPQVVDAVAPVPVLAAGGIANGRQVAAAIALGAEGAWCGSVWLTTEEAETHPVVKEKFLAASSGDTLRSKSRTGKPARMLRSAWTDEWGAPAAPPPMGRMGQMHLAQPALKRIQRAATTGQPGAKELITYFVGQVVGQMNQVGTSRQVVLDMVTEYAGVAERFARQVNEGQ